MNQSTITADRTDSLFGATVLGTGDDKIGRVDGVYLDDATGDPEWIVVKTGMFAGKEHFIPLAEANFADGKTLRIPYALDFIKNAPAMETGRELSQNDEAILYRYYGMSYSDAASPSGLPVGGVAPMTGTERISTGDGAMTLSEERVDVRTERVQTGRAKLRKYVTTEEVVERVPVSRDEVRIVREPITDANVGDAMSGPNISEGEAEIILTEERPVVRKETVPVERVRLVKETVGDQAEIREQVATEHIDTEGIPGERI